MSVEEQAVLDRLNNLEKAIVDFKKAPCHESRLEAVANFAQLIGDPQEGDSIFMLFREEINSRGIGIIKDSQRIKKGNNLKIDGHIFNNILKEHTSNYSTSHLRYRKHDAFCYKRMLSVIGNLGKLYLDRVGARASMTVGRDSTYIERALWKVASELVQAMENARSFSNADDPPPGANGLVQAMGNRLSPLGANNFARGLTRAEALPAHDTPALAVPPAYNTLDPALPPLQRTIPWLSTLAAVPLQRMTIPLASLVRNPLQRMMVLWVSLPPYSVRYLVSSEQASVKGMLALSQGAWAPKL